MQTIGVLGATEAGGSRAQGEAAARPVPQPQPRGDTRATIGLWGPTTHRSNFSTNSLAGIWGRRLPCGQPVAEPQEQQAPGEICWGKSTREGRARSGIPADGAGRALAGGDSARAGSQLEGQAQPALRAALRAALPQVRAEPFVSSFAPGEQGSVQNLVKNAAF